MGVTVDSATNPYTDWEFVRIVDFHIWGTMPTKETNNAKYGSREYREMGTKYFKCI